MALCELQSILVFVLCVQFAEKFAEYKEAARLAKEKSQEKMEMATSPSQVGSLTLFVPMTLINEAMPEHDLLSQFSQSIFNPSSFILIHLIFRTGLQAENYSVFHSEKQTFHKTIKEQQQ